jgi:NAD(P)-dependent dehydrogenase (short-subunit alcohol dehydrogenase family)
VREVTLHALEGTGGTALYLHLDVTRQEDWNRMVAAFGGRFGKLDILVNNAARDSDIAADCDAT